MNGPALTTTGRQLKIGLYLPAAGYGILLVSSGFDGAPRLTEFNASVNIYFWGMISTLIAAVLIHEFVEAYSGPSTGLLEPVPEGRTYQSISYTIAATGTPEDYPNDLGAPFWEADVEIPKRRYVVAGLTFITAIVLAISYPYTVWELSQTALARSSLLPGAVAFAQSIFVLRLLFVGIWPRTYLYWVEHPDTID